MSDKTLVEQIRHYQKDIERCPDNAERMIRCIKRLYVLPILVQHLQETGVGRSVNALRKYNGEVGEAAKSLVAKWKAMVAADESDEDHKQPAQVQQPPPGHQPEHSRDRDRDRDHATRHNETRSRHHHEKRLDSKSERDRHKRDKKSPEKKKHSSGDRHKSSSGSKTETDSSDRRKRKKESEEKDDRRKRMKTVQESESEDEEEDSHSEVDREEELSEAESARERLAEEEEEEDAEEMEDANMEESHEEKSSQESGSDSDSSSGSSSESSDSRHRHKSSSSSTSKHTKNHRTDNKSSSGSRHKSSSSGGSSSKSHHHTSSSSSSKPTISSSSSSSHTNKDDKRHHKDGGSSNKSKSEKSSERTSHHHKSSSSHSSSDKTRDKSRTSQAPDMEALIRENEKKIKKEKQEGETSNSHRKEDKKRNSSVNNTAPVKTEKISKLVKIEKNEDGSIDAGSGASFAEALMVGDAVRSKKKKKLSSNGTTSTSSSSVTPTKKYSSSSEGKLSTEGSSKSTGSSSSKSGGSSHHRNSSPSETADLMKMPELLSNPKKFKSEPLNLDISSTLPEISPNYRPLPHVPDSAYRKLNKTMSEEEAMSSIMTTKYQRTKVFSGNKTGLYATVPSLYSLCIQLLYENIDAVEYTGGVPYDILKPLLEKLNADQLYVLEHHNPYLIDDTDPLWQFHCKKDFRSEIRQELESWRELYLRCMDEREKKLKALTHNISQSMAKSTPVRQAKLAYVDSVAKPPRNVAKKQAKYGTGTSDKKHEILKKAAVGGHTPGIAARDVVPPPPPSAGGGSSSMSSRQSQQILKKKKAPLMAKALQLIKGNRFKR